MRKKIAVFICAISFSNQKRILEGILQEAQKRDVDVFIFTCHVNHSASYMKIKGAYSVMLLPNFSEFDGIIIMKNSIQQMDIVEELESKIRASNIPAVSIDEEINGMHYVGISNYDAQKQMVEHLIFKHQCKRICYVTGLVDNREGKERFQAFIDACRENGIACSKENIFYGDYVFSCGEAAVAKFFSGEQKPDAIVCANDGMAMGAIGALTKMGYKVPQDVLVTGFDNDTFSKYCIPMLSTVDQRQEELGQSAIEILLTNSLKTQVKKCVEPQVIIGESCGCLKKAKFSVDEVRNTYSREIGTISQAVDCMKNMSIELAGLESMEELYERLQKYIIASDMKAFFLCIEKEDDLLEIPLAYINNEFKKIAPYKKGSVLPNSVRNTSKPAFYIVTSLFCNDINFGYIVQRDSRFALESELAYSWVVNVGIAIENIRKIGLMQEMVNRLNSMWMYDTLTNLYNRGGFYYFAQKMLTRMQEVHGKCFLIFFDLDGLKAVNDTKGHEMGDQYIVAMAKVIQEVLEKTKQTTSIGMRYGGDEFVVFGECITEQEPIVFIESVHEEICEVNKNRNDFNLSCSMGYSLHNAVEIEDLNGLIEEADKKMYEEKKAKRGRNTR
ncbi:MAG: GGDEF domain-containing protein [Lachnospiraceae bacterium]|nr:GGDEF domain-containing protein [Lachnospiraceae bacterium]